MTEVDTIRPPYEKELDAQTASAVIEAMKRANHRTAWVVLA